MERSRGHLPFDGLSARTCDVMLFPEVINGLVNGRSSSHEVMDRRRRCIPWGGNWSPLLANDVSKLRSGG